MRVRGRPGVETSLGRVAPGGSKGGPAAASGLAALPSAFPLQSPPPRGPRLNALSLGRLPGLVSPLKGERPSITLALPHPSAALASLPAPQARLSPQLQGLRRTQERAPGTDLPCAPGVPGEEKPPRHRLPRGFARRGSPLGAGRRGSVTSSGGRSRRNRVEGGVRGMGVALRGGSPS